MILKLCLVFVFYIFICYNTCQWTLKHTDSRYSNSGESGERKRKEDKFDFVFFRSVILGRKNLPLSIWFQCFLYLDKSNNSLRGSITALLYLLHHSMKCKLQMSFLQGLVQNTYYYYSIQKKRGPPTYMR